MFWLPLCRPRWCSRFVLPTMAPLRSPPVWLAGDPLLIFSWRISGWGDRCLLRREHVIFITSTRHDSLRSATLLSSGFFQHHQTYRASDNSHAENPQRVSMYFINIDATTWKRHGRLRFLQRDLFSYFGWSALVHQVDVLVPPDAEKSQTWNRKRDLH